MFSENTKIGILLTSLGLLFTFLGILMFFDRFFLSMGNLLFLAGVAFSIGPKSTLTFFTQWRKIKGTVVFFTGLLLVISGWSKIGLFIEFFGFINLFGDFFPFVIRFIRSLPVVGAATYAPGIRQLCDRILGNESLELPV